MVGAERLEPHTGIGGVFGLDRVGREGVSASHDLSFVAFWINALRRIDLERAKILAS
jgi:hypothetical protein